MRTIALAACLAFCAAAAPAQNQQPASAAAPAVGAVVNVHLTVSHVRPCWSDGCPEILYVDVVIDGKKYELTGDASYGRKSKIPNGAVLMPGDYQASLKKDEPSASGMLYQVYELLLPRGDTWEGTVSGA